MDSSNHKCNWYNNDMDYIYNEYWGALKLTNTHTQLIKKPVCTYMYHFIINFITVHQHNKIFSYYWN